MAESDSSIMTPDNGIDMGTSVMTDSMNIIADSDSDPSIMTGNSTDIMTGNSQPLTRTIGKPKPDKDPNALKIASFRTKEGVWAEFSSKAESDGLTATDVLKAAMEQYLSGEYNPRVITGISTLARHTDNSMTRNDVLEIVNTLISTRINTGISTEVMQSNIMTAISTLSLPTSDSINTLINTAISTELASLRAEIGRSQEQKYQELSDKYQGLEDELSDNNRTVQDKNQELSDNVLALIPTDIITNERIEELEAYIQNQIQAVRDELKKL